VCREGLLSGVRPVSVPGEKSPTSRKEREKWGTPFVSIFSKQLKIDVGHPSYEQHLSLVESERTSGPKPPA
jgi:hypothetical protein